MSKYNILQQRDGDFVVNSYVSEDLGNYMSAPLGYMLYKISAETLTITDSLFVADTLQRVYLLARDPIGEGNIRATLKYHEDSDSTFLHLQRFPDNDLHAIPGQDIVTSVCEGLVYGGDGCSLFDCRGDLILRYFKMMDDETFDEYIVRFGPDGSTKYHALFQGNGEGTGRMLEVYKEAPLQYYMFKETNDDIRPNLSVVVTDTLFHKNTTILNNILREQVINPYCTMYEYLKFENMSTEGEVIPVGGNDVLVAAPYQQDTNFYPWTATYGVAVAKYDLRTMQLKDYIVFGENNYNSPECMGLKMMPDGTVYFAYKRKKYEPNINIVKMDANLNVEWNRFYKTGDIYMYGTLGLSTVCDDSEGNENGIAWLWMATKGEGNDKRGWVHFYISHDGTVGTNETGIEVRPYAFWPNPAHDRLQLQYSPDVKPTSIELYDLQGRLVRSQRNGLESIDMGGLPAGTYTLRVTLEDGKAYSDKVVKE